MAETMSNVERALWRIAELGARCSQLDAAGGRGPLWAELEQTIAGLDAEVESARQAVDQAPAQVRSLEGRLAVARKERDREQVRAQELLADAEAARRERDRERVRAQECLAEAEAARRERDRDRQKARQAVAAAKTAAAESDARTTAAEAAADQALAARDQALAAFDRAVSDGERAAAARDEAVASLEVATARVAQLEAMLTAAAGERDAAVAAEALAAAERDEVVEALAARADAAVVVLPGVALPAPADTPPDGPIAATEQPHVERVSWQPTWSEWARDAQETAPAGTDTPAVAETDDDVVDVTTLAEVVDMTSRTEEVVEVAADEVTDDDVVVSDEESVRRYLNVAATIGQLLPEDLGPLLLSGATVMRREGRLFATVAVTTNPWTSSGSDGAQQAKKFADAGFRVEWTSTQPLAC
jgi:hypothetical protein